MVDVTWLDLADNQLGDTGLIELFECEVLKNVQYLKDNALLIKTTMFPILDIVRNAKYDIHNVESNVIDNIVYHTLYKEKNRYSKTEKEI